jgi:hypothetical protein
MVVTERRDFVRLFCLAVEAFSASDVPGDSVRGTLFGGPAASLAQTRVGEAMTTKALLTQTLGVGIVLLLSACDVTRNMRSDIARIGGGGGSASPPAPTAPQTAMSSKPQRNDPKANDAKATDGKSLSSSKDPSGDGSNQQLPNLVGKNESELRTMFGPPTHEEDRAPEKFWRYRAGQCSLDIHLFPDVQTHQFGTLSYEVTSYDNTDEGKRRCVAQFKYRADSAG